jgi:glutamate racemase
VQLIAQGEIVAKSLADYLQRHPEMEQTISRTGHSEYLTTERADSFAQMASVFLHTPVEATQITLS